jgi:hypothetical protein
MKMQTFTLKGRVASIGDGIVKGIARIVNSESELDKIQPGDIMGGFVTQQYSAARIICLA